MPHQKIMETGLRVPAGLSSLREPTRAQANRTSRFPLQRRRRRRRASGPPASPHAGNTRGGFPAANSPGPTIDMYNSSAGDSVGYVQAASPQPSSFPAIAVSRAPLNYSPTILAINSKIA
ncbi:hypothetical protein NQ318_019098 [Aromia moschata]|uniref:Uncharacterized protein n=1 Tax=Aromia moschata TaxID=1265417 RepID=A0AAV8Y836_9CUCU|nr:hypothetical protein NQ318_019098 [Aromia moschata]